MEPIEPLQAVPALRACPVVTRSHISGVQFALKIDRTRDVRTVKQELRVLQSLGPCRQVCRVHDSGTMDGRAFLVMDLLGSNLAEVRRYQLGGKATPGVAKVVGASLLTALEGLHAQGYVHRDVKPANFAMSPPGEMPADRCTWMLIDFGLARKFVGEDGGVLPERTDSSFRGSTTYASINAHEDRDLGRRDDLWSWFYVLVELLEGES